MDSEKLSARAISSALAVIMLVTACAAPRTDEQRAQDIAEFQKNRIETRQQLMQRIETAVDRLQPPLKACVSFLETGSFDPGPLVAAGFQPRDFALGTGTVYRLPTEEDFDLEVSMIEARANNPDPKCSLNGPRKLFPVGSALEKMGFERRVGVPGLILARDGVDLKLRGVAYRRGRGWNSRPEGPAYVTIKRLRAE